MNTAILHSCRALSVSSTVDLLMVLCLLTRTMWGIIKIVASNAYGLNVVKWNSYKLLNTFSENYRTMPNILSEYKREQETRVLRKFIFQSDIGKVYRMKQNP